jgi:hypothetical protein
MAQFSRKHVNSAENSKSSIDDLKTTIPRNKLLGM